RGPDAGARARRAPRRPGGRAPGARRRPAPSRSCGASESEREDLLLLLLQELVDLHDVLVRRLLDLIVPAALLVLGDGRLLVLRHRLELVVRLAPDVADGDAPLFRHFPRALRQLL